MTDPYRAAAHASGVPESLLRAEGAQESTRVKLYRITDIMPLVVLDYDGKIESTDERGVQLYAVPVERTGDVQADLPLYLKVRKRPNKPFAVGEVVKVDARRLDRIIVDERPVQEYLAKTFKQLEPYERWYTVERVEYLSESVQVHLVPVIAGDPLAPAYTFSDDDMAAYDVGMVIPLDMRGLTV